MTAAQQKDFFTKRWRKVRRPEPLEHQIQIALVQHLKYRCRPDVIYFHVPNGGWRDEREAAKFKAMGTLAGVADMIFIWNDLKSIQQPCTAILFLELKRAGGQLSDAQWEFMERLNKHVPGVCYHMADSIDSALEILRAHGILKN
jgi:hypothetical protein